MRPDKWDDSNPYDVCYDKPGAYVEQGFKQALSAGLIWSHFSIEHGLLEISSNKSAASRAICS